MGSVGLGCFWVFSLTFGIGVICWGAKDTPLWLRRTRGHVPPSPSFFSPAWGFPPIPVGATPICHIPGYSLRPFCQGKFGGFFHLLMPKHKVLRNWLMHRAQNPHFSQKSHLPVTLGAKFQCFFPKQAGVTAGSWDAMGLQGPHVATKILGASLKHPTNPHFLP